VCAGVSGQRNHPLASLEVLGRYGDAGGETSLLVAAHFGGPSPATVIVAWNNAAAQLTVGPVVGFFPSTEDRNSTSFGAARCGFGHGPQRSQASARPGCLGNFPQHIVASLLVLGFLRAALVEGYGGHLTVTTRKHDPVRSNHGERNQCDAQTAIQNGTKLEGMRFVLVGPAKLTRSGQQCEWPSFSVISWHVRLRGPLLRGAVCVRRVLFRIARRGNLLGGNQTIPASVSDGAGPGCVGTGPGFHQD
jgi:hypothetical protein